MKAAKCDEGREVLADREGDEGREVLEGREMLADREGHAGREVLEGEAAECSKVANAMKASKVAKAMKATKCSKDAENTTPLLGPYGCRAFEQRLERDYPIKDPKEQVETFGATSTDATEWEAIPLLAFFENDRLQLKYMWLERDTLTRLPPPSLVIDVCGAPAV